MLPNGSVFVLTTNLFNAAVGPMAFADLYRGRWRIEEAFKLVKARLQVENWSGILPHTVEQDFYATLVRANCAAVLALAARPQDATLGAPMPNPAGWRVQLNRTLVVKSLRHHLARLLLNFKFDDVFARLLERLRAPAALERTRPERSAPRKKKVRLAEFHMAYKAAYLNGIASNWQQKEAPRLFCNNLGAPSAMYPVFNRRRKSAWSATLAYHSQLVIAQPPFCGAFKKMAAWGGVWPQRTIHGKLRLTQLKQRLTQHRQKGNCRYGRSAGA